MTDLAESKVRESFELQMKRRGWNHSSYYKRAILGVRREIAGEYLDWDMESHWRTYRCGFSDGILVTASAKCGNVTEPL